MLARMAPDRSFKARSSASSALKLPGDADRAADDLLPGRQDADDLAVQHEGEEAPLGGGDLRDAGIGLRSLLVQGEVDLVGAELRLRLAGIRDRGTVQLDLALEQDPAPDRRLPLVVGLGGSAAMAFRQGLRKELRALGQGPAEMGQRFRFGSEIGPVDVREQAQLQAARRGQQPLDPVPVPLLDARQLHDDPVALRSPGGDLGFHHPELVDAVLDDLEGALVGAGLDAPLVVGPLREGAAVAAEGEGILPEPCGHAAQGGFRDPLHLESRTLQPEDGRREALLLEPLLEAVTGLLQVPLQSILALDLQFVMDAAFQVEAEADLLEWNEEPGADQADGQDPRRANARTLAHERLRGNGVEQRHGSCRGGSRQVLGEMRGRPCLATLFRLHSLKSRSSSGRGDRKGAVPGSILAEPGPFRGRAPGKRLPGWARRLPRGNGISGNGPCLAGTPVQVPGRPWRKDDRTIG